MQYGYSLEHIRIMLFRMVAMMQWTLVILFAINGGYSGTVYEYPMPDYPTCMSMVSANTDRRQGARPMPQTVIFCTDRAKDGAKR